jgi:hypothetical protein
MATSLKQTEANRRNAARSTGPRTLEGKAASRFNALKSGVNASAEFIPGEDSLEYDDVRIAYDLRWNPQTPEQRCLVDRLIRCDWLQRRLGKAEAHLWRYRQGSYHPDDAGQALTALGTAQANGGADFERLQRRINQTQRTYDKTLETLQAMSTAAAETLAEAPAAEVGQSLSPATEPPETANPQPNQPDAPENGFVLSNPLSPQPAGEASTTPNPQPLAPSPASEASLLLYCSRPHS